MIRILERRKLDSLLYRCVEGDTLENIATRFQISTEEIKRLNPLYSSVYPGCVLYLAGLGKRRVIVGPLETLYDIASKNNTTVDHVMRINNLSTEKVFVGMQILLD